MGNSRIGSTLLQRIRHTALAGLLVTSFSALAQEDLSQLNVVLDIDALYEPVAWKPVHGETAAELLRELQTKHYSSIEIDDSFSSVVFDNYLDALDGSH